MGTCYIDRILTEIILTLCFFISN